MCMPSVHVSLCFNFYLNKILDAFFSLVLNRPRSLLVFINPYGGKKHAETIFYSTVRKVFDLAGIHTKVIGNIHFYVSTHSI